MNDVKISSDEIRISPVFSARFSFNAGQLNCEWAPRDPAARERRLLMGKYRKARDNFLADVSQQLGVRILCVEAKP